MVLTVRLVFLVVACLLFILAAAGVQSRVNLEAAGLAFLTMAFLLT